MNNTVLGVLLLTNSFLNSLSHCLFLGILFLITVITTCNKLKMKDHLMIICVNLTHKAINLPKLLLYDQVTMQKAELLNFVQ